MAICGFDSTEEFFKGTIFGWDQSWGKWNSLTNVPSEWMPVPEGAFFLDEASTQRAVRARRYSSIF